jgi:hypothetical protein
LVSELEQAQGSRETRLAYADPPYPGRAHLYADHPDYAGEVDHVALIERLADNYDGWALSTSAEALGDVLRLVEHLEARPYRVLAWVKHTVKVSWEPLIVVSARKPEGVRDWIQVEPDSYQWRARPDSYVIGQKPKPFCQWMFAWLGAEPGDTFDDLFPGSGNVGAAWQEWQQQPRFELHRSPSAEKRAGRRAAAKANDPSLWDVA